MGAFLFKPNTEKHNESGEGNGLKYALSSMQGWRITMEDAHTAVANLQGDLKEWSFFAVFDGHAGDKVSGICAEHLLTSIISGETFKKATCVAEKGADSTAQSIEDVKQGISNGFLKLDDYLREVPELASGEDKSGTTAVCAFISPDRIFVANCGDSRAVLCRGGDVRLSTLDHKPCNPIERERICNAGGSVMIQRVNGSLAVSRALGDFEYKNVKDMGPCEQLVSPEPDVIFDERAPNDEFLVLACDGIWDVMSNEDLCKFIHSRLLVYEDIETVANCVIDACFYKGSRDNMSVVLILFPGAPKISEEAIAKEKQLEEQIKNELTECCKQNEKVFALDDIIPTLKDKIPNFPPGGGIESKRRLIEDIFKELRPDCVEVEGTEESTNMDCTVGS